MGSVPALRAALDLLHFPSQAVLLRSGPLPQGVAVLLRIAAGDQETITRMSAAEGRSRETIREAAAFFLEQVMLNPNADSYRVLGSSPEASHAELRQNMSLLLQWLHPDLDRREARSVFAARVTQAWNDLKTPERRSAYDRAMGSLMEKRRSLRGQRATLGSNKKTTIRGEVRRAMDNRSYYPRPWQPRHHPVGLLRKIMFFLLGSYPYRK
jgi:hypothetical protein